MYFESVCYQFPYRFCPQATKLDDQIERKTKPAGCKDMDKTIKQKSKRAKGKVSRGRRATETKTDGQSVTERLKKTFEKPQVPLQLSVVFVNLRL